MDEGDRPTDADGSAGRDESRSEESEDRLDGSDGEIAGEPSGDAPDDPAEGDPTVDDGPDEQTGGSRAGEPADDSETSEPSGDSEVPDGDRTGPDSEVPDGERTPSGSGAVSASGTAFGSGSASDAGKTGDGDESVGVGGEVAGEDRAEASEPSEPDGNDSLWYRFRHDRDGALMWLREMLSSVGVVLLVGLLLFGVSGIWPPMVAVESGSMEPNMRVGDLVFVTEPGRLAPDAADNGVGVVTHEAGAEADYRTFGSYGSVVIYTPPERTGSPIIHRAMFRVTEGENWYDRADGQYHNAVDCGSLANCPAPHDGYITLGDNNGAYDQASGLSPPVKAEWVDGVARLRVPYLGYIRLLATGQVELNEAIAGTVGSGLPSAGPALASSAPAA